ncbi:hypothetical protein [Pantoea sp.]|uniref:hypothetical protein n=1 Tax=Pantoea sp. TaxID=69393 RepID=UPI0031CE7D27
MQTTLHQQGLVFTRVPDEAYGRNYNGTGESLDALKARTTPMDITNPYKSAHASCAQAFVATAISIEHRYSEMEMQIPPTQISPLIVASTTKASRGMSFYATDEQPEQLSIQVPEAVKTEFQWSSKLPEMEFSIPLPELWLAHPAHPSAINASAFVTPHIISDDAESMVISEPASPMTESKVLIAESINVDEKVLFSGSAQVGALVQFYIDEVLVGSTESDAQGHWQFMPPASLPAATHTFSAVIANESGILTNHVDLSFVINSLPDVSITLIDDNDLAQIDVGLIDRVMQHEEMPTSLAPIIITAEMLEDWQTQDGIRSVDMLPYGDLLLDNEWESAHITWH